MLFLAVSRVMWKQSYFSIFFLLGGFYIIGVHWGMGLSILYQETQSILLWPVMWEMCSLFAFLISLSCWLTLKQDLGKADSSGNVLFLVVLVFAKFSIKSVQQAKKPASPLHSLSPPIIFLWSYCSLEYFCTYIALVCVYTYKYLRIFSMERLNRNNP